MRIVLVIAALLVAAGCQRSSHAPQTASVLAAPAPAASIVASPPAPVSNGVPARPKKGASLIGTAVARTGAGTKQNEDSDQPGYGVSDPCAGLVDDDAIDGCLAREEAAAPDRAGGYGEEEVIDHPEIDPRDRALMDAEEADAIGGRQDGDPFDTPDQGPDSPPGDDYSPSNDLPSDDPPPADYPPDENADQPPAPDPYQR